MLSSPLEIMAKLKSREHCSESNIQEIYKFYSDVNWIYNPINAPAKTRMKSYGLVNIYGLILLSEKQKIYIYIMHT